MYCLKLKAKTDEAMMIKCSKVTIANGCGTIKPILVCLQLVALRINCYYLMIM